ncbi:MAG: CRISPR-associated endonuclease Cas1 [Desulfovibrio sp.]|nr:CRISPR-associated endonuclease Cas1 [Desulfovibrio sp.]
MQDEAGSLTSWLAGHCWLECHLVLRNMFADAVVEHPLLVFDAVFKYAARQRVPPWPAWLFRPDTSCASRLGTHRRYGLTLIFPQCQDVGLGHAVLDCLRDWLASGNRHFCLDSADEPRVLNGGEALALLLHSLPQAEHALRLDVLTPLPFTTPQGWKGEVTAPWLGAAILRRVQRLFGPMHPLLLDAAARSWEELRLLPWFWNYEEHKHQSRSTKGTRYLNGFCGPLYLEGHLAPVLPLLALACRCNVGSRLSAGQGALRAAQERADLDCALLALETWLHAWQALSLRIPGLTRDLPEGVYEALCAQRLEALRSPWTPTPRLDMLLGLGLHHLLHTCVSRALPDLALRWQECLPWMPEDFLQRAAHLLPCANTILPAVLTRFAALCQHHAPSLQEQAPTKTSAAPNAPCGETLAQPKAEGQAAWTSEEAQTPATESGTDGRPCPLRRPCYLLHPGAAVTLDDERICSRYDGTLLGHVPLGHVSMLILQGAGSVSIPLLRACEERNIPVIFCTASGRFCNILAPGSPAWRERGDAQLRHWDALGESGRLRVGIALVMVGIRHRCAWLETLDMGPSVSYAAASALRLLEQTPARSRALGLEGTFARQYFGIVNRLVAPFGYASAGRRPRQRPDAWNCLLDTASSLVYSRLCVLLHGEGLSPFRGYLHCQHDRYATLAADVQEIFRARTERWLVTIIQGGELDSAWLNHDADGRQWTLAREGWAFLVNSFEQEVRTARDGLAETWLEIMEGQVRRLRLWCTGRAPLHVHDGRAWQEVFASTATHRR